MEGNSNQNSVVLAWYWNGIKKKNYKNWSTLRQLIDFWQKCQWNPVRRREISAMVTEQLKWNKYVANKIMKRFSIILVITEIKIKPELETTINTLEWLNLKWLTVLKGSKDENQLEFSHIVDGTVKSYNNFVNWSGIFSWSLIHSKPIQSFHLQSFTQDKNICTLKKCIHECL